MFPDRMGLLIFAAMNSTQEQKTIIAVVGPTASGKTGTAIALAQHYGCEIISFDSRQFYREMSIGTAKPTPDELDEAPHHFIDNLSIHDSYSVGQYEEEALALTEKLFEENDKIIMVGGSGLYLDAVSQGFDAFPEVDPAIREALNEQLLEKGLESLQEELQIADPEYYEEADIQNPHRVIRALEICRGTGNTFTSYRTAPKKERPFKVIKIGMEWERTELYERINRRVDIMMELGQEEEARGLYPLRDLNSLQTVGYRELFSYFDGEIPLDFAISEIKKNSRRYAKRQLTWFRRDKDTFWATPENTTAMIEHIDKTCS